MVSGLCYINLNEVSPSHRMTPPPLERAMLQQAQEALGVMSLERKRLQAETKSLNKKIAEM